MSTCLQEPSPESTKKVLLGRRTAMQDTLRLVVGAPEDVPSHVTASPVSQALIPQTCMSEALIAQRGGAAQMTKQ